MMPCTSWYWGARAWGAVSITPRASSLLRTSLPRTGLASELHTPADKWGKGQGTSQQSSRSPYNLGIVTDLNLNKAYLLFRFT